MGFVEYRDRKGPRNSKMTNAKAPKWCKGMSFAPRHVIMSLPAPQPQLDKKKRKR
jgi:hypothetical protein